MPPSSRRPSVIFTPSLSFFLLALLFSSSAVLSIASARFPHHAAHATQSSSRLPLPKHNKHTLLPGDLSHHGSAQDTATASSPTAYHISSSHPNASDANSGQDPAHPWRTLHRAESVAPLLTPGSSILLQAGDTWVLDTAWFLTDMPGTPSSPIVISWYDGGSQGDAAKKDREPSTSSHTSSSSYFSFRGTLPLTKNRPAILRAINASAGPTLTINNSSGIAVRGIEIGGGENGVAFTNDVRHGESATTYEFFEVSDCYFHNIRGLNYDPQTGSWWGSAVAMAAAHSGVTLRDVSIVHNLVNDSDTFYINQVPYTGWTRSYVVNLNVSCNTISAVSYNTLFLDTTAFVSVDRNNFLHNTPRQLFVAGTTDIILGTVNSSVSITRNEIGYRGEFQPGGPDGCAIDFETFADGVLVADNYIHHSYGAGIMVFGHERTSINLHLSGNVMLYNGCNQTRDDHGGIAFMFVNSSGTIHNNIFATCPGTPLFFARVPNATSGWDISNNFIDGVNATLLTLDPPVMTLVPGATAVDASVLHASCPQTNAKLRYTMDGSTPIASSDEWPAGPGGVSLPTWAIAVVTRCFPPAVGSEDEQRLVESVMGRDILASEMKMKSGTGKERTEAGHEEWRGWRERVGLVVVASAASGGIYYNGE